MSPTSTGSSGDGRNGGDHALEGAPVPVGVDLPLVFVGNWDRSANGRALKARFKDVAHLHLLDPIYAPGPLLALRRGAATYLHGRSVGGTNPSLVEMMHFGLPILYFDYTFNRATTEDMARFFNDAATLRSLVAAPTNDRKGGAQMLRIARQRYTRGSGRGRIFQTAGGRDVITKTPIPGVVIITPPRHEDARGFFSETWNRRDWAARGIDIDFVQDNHSHSARAGTLRGLHYQAPPQAQDKLVRCVRGEVFDVVVDIRRGSPSYGKWYGVELSAQNGRQLLIPKGLLHGFVTRAPDTEIIYKCSAYYAPEYEGTVRFDDADIGINWGLGGAAPILSDKDASAAFFRDLDTHFTYQEQDA